ncbi:MAG: NAD(P)/FAD-dependent oxidoreductase [Flavobacteriaceae bacterium]
MIYDTLIIGGGVSGMQCALVLGSGLSKPYAKGKKVGIILHQRASHLQNALFNNVLGLEKGAKGADLLESGRNHLAESYAEVHQIENEKVISVMEEDGFYDILTNKNSYRTKIVVLALNYSKPFSIEGLESYLIPHQKANPAKDRIQLKNNDHFIKKGLYVCGTLAGWRSQFSIAAGSGASVATDILTLWNDGNHTKIHDKI